MSIFSRKPKSILGIDVGASAVKLVELTRDGGRARLRTYGFTERSAPVAGSDPREAVSDMGVIIRALRDRCGATATTAIASLPTFSVFSSIITVPEMPKKELPNAIRLEAKKFVPLPLEEMILNWEILPKLPESMQRKESPRDVKTAGDLTQRTISGGTTKPLAVLITAAEKKLVARSVDIFKAAGITLASLETEAFALVRSLVGNDRSTLLLVDVGARNTDLSLVAEGIPLLNRSIDLGGDRCTEEIAKATRLSWRAAEQLKHDIARVPRPEALPIFTSVLAPLVNEIRYITGVHQSHSGGRIEKIILTGGSSALVALASFLASQLSLTVVLGDPWARVATPADLAPVLADIGPRMSVAVGLAMRGI